LSSSDVGEEARFVDAAIVLLCVLLDDPSSQKLKASLYQDRPLGHYCLESPTSPALLILQLPMLRHDVKILGIAPSASWH
jgi:hypothetical protein